MFYLVIFGSEISRANQELKHSEVFLGYFSNHALPFYFKRFVLKTVSKSLLWEGGTLERKGLELTKVQSILFP